MRNILRLTFFLFIAVATSACLTITEDYTFKTSGGGSMRYTVDMSQMAQLIQMAQSQEEGAAPTNMDQMSLHKFESPLSGIKGISKVKVVDDAKKYVFNLAFEFDNLDALNEAMNVILSEPSADGTPAPAHTFFVKDGNQLVRTHLSSNQTAKGLMEQLGASDDSDQALAILQSMKYKLRFTFKKPVEAVYSSAEATYDNGGKSINIETDFATLANTTDVLNATVLIK